MRSTRAPPSHWAQGFAASSNPAHRPAGFSHPPPGSHARMRAVPGDFPKRHHRVQQPLRQPPCVPRMHVHLGWLGAGQRRALPQPGRPALLPCSILRGLEQQPPPEPRLLRSPAGAAAKCGHLDQVRASAQRTAGGGCCRGAAAGEAAAGCCWSHPPAAAEPGAGAACGGDRHVLPELQAASRRVWADRWADGELSSSVMLQVPRVPPAALLMNHDAWRCFAPPLQAGRSADAAGRRPAARGARGAAAGAAPHRCGRRGGFQVVGRGSEVGGQRLSHRSPWFGSNRKKGGPGER